MDFTNASLSPRQRLLLQALRGPVTTDASTTSTTEPSTFPTPQDPPHQKDDITSLRAEVCISNIDICLCFPLSPPPPPPLQILVHPLDDPPFNPLDWYR